MLIRLQQMTSEVSGAMFCLGCSKCEWVVALAIAIVEDRYAIPVIRRDNEHWVGLIVSTASPKCLLFPSTRVCA